MNPVILLFAFLLFSEFNPVFPGTNGRQIGNTKGLSAIEFEMTKVNREIETCEDMLLLDDRYREFAAAQSLEEKTEVLLTGEEDTEIFIPPSEVVEDETETDENEIADKGEEEESEFARYAALSEIERESLSQKIKDLNARVNELQKAFDELALAEIKSLSKIAKKWQEDPERAALLADFAAFKNFVGLDANRLVTVALGNSEQAPTEDVRKHYKRVVRKLRKLGYYIVFDGHAQTAELFADAAGSNGIAITSGQPTSHKFKDAKVIAVSNSYMRLEMFAHATRNVVSSDSPVGLALAIFGRANTALDASQVWSNRLPRWARDLDQRNANLGIKYEKIQHVADADALLALERLSTPVFPQQVSDPLVSETKSYADQIAELESKLSYVEQVYAGRSVLKANSPYSVIFGSGKYAEPYVQQLYNISRFLGTYNIPVVTGGAGGMMHVANAGAFSGGGPSIGIPITGRNQLKAEHTVHSESQTATVEASDYLVRVHLLLVNADVVMYAPGGSGTMRELATALVRDAGSPDTQTSHVFINKSYYEKFVAWLFERTDLPASYRARIHIAENPADLEKIIHPRVKQGVMSVQVNAARNAVLKFKCSQAFDRGF